MEYNGQWYEVSIDGCVFGKRGELKQRLYKGYLTVTLGTDNRTRVRVHQLVAKEYVSNPLRLETVHHKDEVKTNNHYSNLEWRTRVDNVKIEQDEPVQATSLHDPSFGLWFPCQAEAGRTGFQQPNISKCLSGERKSHKGYKWEKSVAA